MHTNSSDSRWHCGSRIDDEPAGRRNFATRSMIKVAMTAILLGSVSPAVSRADCLIPVHVAKSAVTTVLNLPYTTSPNKSQSLDLYLPTNTKNPPIVLWIHGGSFITGDKSGGRTFADVLATFGIATAALNYRLTTSTKNLFPAAISDVRCAASWLQANASTLGFNGARFAILGESAGGNLGGVLGVSADPGGAMDTTADCAASYAVPEFVAVADYYGLNDIDDAAAMNKGQTHTATGYLGVSPVVNTALAAEASPITYVVPATPPFFLARGTDDETMPEAQATDMFAALQEADVPAQYFDIPGLGHGFNPFDVADYPQLQTSGCALVEFFQTEFGKANFKR